jgi:hypothetical protein
MSDFNIFTIPDEYLTDVQVVKKTNIYIKNGEISAEDMPKFLNDEGWSTYTYYRDHPEFDKLRTHLSEQGFIDKVSTSWNNDTVLKPFSLNGVDFIIGDRFYCASAMHFHLKFRKN